MSTYKTLDEKRVNEKAKRLFDEERKRERLDGWLFIKEIVKTSNEKCKDLPNELKAAFALKAIAEKLPLQISENAIFAGTQRDAFAKSYALINPNFTVESFSGYCDPTAVFDDIEPNESLNVDHIQALKAYDQNTDYVKALKQTYKCCEKYTAEVCFFVEQVTGHIVPDLKNIIEKGVKRTIEQINTRFEKEEDELKRINFEAMKIALESVLIITERYQKIAEEQYKRADKARREELSLMISTLKKIPAKGADNLYEAIQSFILVWQMMCLEQAPNPFAFSVGNADRIFEPYREKTKMDRQTTAALFKHFLVFFNVGNRSWAISQNIILSGRDLNGHDLTNTCTYAFLDAYYDMNLPQPILSIKLHQKTPIKLFEEMGKFFFTPGCLTPSLFNDDAMFKVLTKAHIEPEDLPNYAIAGCQEPLIMGKDNGNTTNSWLNLAKILELTINDGVSTISNKRIGPATGFNNPRERLEKIRDLFYKNLEFYTEQMVQASNNASSAVSCLPVPFLSTLMGGLETGYDMRDIHHQGTKYNGSGCLIHGLTVVADSFIAIDRLLEERPEESDRLIQALKNNFEQDEALRQYLRQCPKFGNNLHIVDAEAATLASRVADLISAKKNYLGNPFRPDFSTPSTHLLYGQWVGATPDGRKAKDMLNYGVDPLYGDANNGLGFRILSGFNLPYEKMFGGYASHFGVNPKYFKANGFDKKGIEFMNRVIKPLFFNNQNKSVSPFYLYVNVTSAETLRKVLENPKKYAPSGVYIMRIHGTFVNFLDLSPAIQNDIITRLDPASTAV